MAHDLGLKKRKQKQWVPFLCHLLNINNLKKIEDLIPTMLTEQGILARRNPLLTI
jgi:hypothetical protein